MGAQSRISKWGTSLAVRIPKSIAQQLGVREGSTVEMISRGDHVVLRKRVYDLDGLLAEVTDDNLHPEYNSSSLQGEEEW